VHGNRGFTLVEVTVAISLTAVVMVMAHQVFAGVIDGSKRANEARLALAAEMNGWRRLTALVGSVLVGPTDADAFVGEPESVSFTAWDRDATGLNVRRRLVLRLDEGKLVLHGLAPIAVALADSVRATTLDYLMDPGATATWVRRWSSSATVPLAIRLRLTRQTGADTLLMIIGARG